MPDNSLYQKFLNCIEAISDDKSYKEEARTHIKFIKEEWKRRWDDFMDGKYKPSRPDIGLL
jgi:hypothetical protein